jgi:hypothetical protein
MVHQDSKIALDSAWLNLSKEIKTCRKTNRPTYEFLNLMIVFIRAAVVWFFSTAWEILLGVQKPVIKFLIPKTYFNAY